MKKPVKIVLIVLLCIIGAAVLAVGAFLAIYSIKEWKPEDVDRIGMSEGQNPLNVGDTFDVLSLNVGYGALSSDQDCYFDGGQTVVPEDESIIERNVNGMSEILKRENAQVYFLQEVDINAKRSYYMNLRERFEEALKMGSMYACNFDVWYVPFSKGMGKVEAGIVTMTNYKISEAERVSLPNPWTWPMRTVNLKRCLLVSRTPIEGSDKELVLINLHLEAYDNDEGKTAQTKMLAEIMAEEYAKGNYVIAGGDFNQTFEPVQDACPMTEESIAKGRWTPQVIKNSDLPEGFSFAVTPDPTCRLDETALTEDTQKYIIDGFIVSDNVAVNTVKTLDEGFAYTDHNPIKINVTLK